MKKVFVLIATLILTAGFLIITAPAALALCHVVSFSKSNYDVKENEGKVTITINRVIAGPGCTGTMEYSTSDDTAKAPSDYRSTSGTEGILNPTQATFTFDVPIVDDTTFESEEKFRVHFKHTADNGQGVASGSATVTIQDNDPAPPPPAATSPPAKKSPSPSASPSPSPSPGATAAEEIEESPSLSESPNPTASPSPRTLAEQEEESGRSVWPIVGLVALVVAAGAGGGWWWLKRRAA